MKKNVVILTLLLLCSLFLPLTTVKADGIIVPPLPPCPRGDCPIPLPRPISQLEIRYHHVTVSIENQLAKTHVDQVFYNPNSWPVEGTYVFPLPIDAVVSDFILWVEGEPVSGKVLSAEEARSYYEKIVSDLRDPALLEYIGRGAVQASIFPIPPQGERRIELEYTQVLTAENGLVRFSYPLNTEKFSLQPLQDVSIRVEIRDKQSIRAVYSPSHAVSQDRKSENHVTVGYEAINSLPDADFLLYYSLGEKEAFHLFTYRDPADPLDPDGFFLLLLAPKPETGSEHIAKDVLLVLDHSGSMDGDKFLQAQSALRYILKQLNPNDRFYLQAFSTGVETYASGLRSASEVNEALRWVDRLSAVGSTDINRALLEASAVADRERPTYLIFLTDGLPTEGVVETSQILQNFASAAPDNLRLFTFGVGYDVDTVLLDTLSQDHHGQSMYVRPDEKLDEILSAFYERISTPVLTDLKLDFGTITAYDVYPDPLPDLFSGSQVVAAGRYREGGVSDIVLTGEINSRRQEIRFPHQVFSMDSRGGTSSLDSLPRLWATRKIGYLLNKIRLNGPDQETIQQIVKLSVRYGIVTPYTSYLVTEPAPIGAQEQEQIAIDAFGQALETPLETTGKSAVERADQEGKMQSAEVAPAAPLIQNTEGISTTQGMSIRVIGSRTFILQDGIWIDTLFDPDKMPVQRISFLSSEYDQLLKARADIAPALSLSAQMILVIDGKAYQVISEGEVIEPVVLPSPLSTQSTQATAASLSPLSTIQPQSTTSVPGLDPTSRPSQRSEPCASVALLSLAAIGLWRMKRST